MITSVSNPQIKAIIQLQKKSKARWQQRVFVVEGPKMVFEAPGEWVEKVYVSESYLGRLREAVQKRDGEREEVAGSRVIQETLRRLEDFSYEVVSDSVLKAASDTQTPQGILALVKMPEYVLKDLLVPYGGQCRAEPAGSRTEVVKSQPGPAPSLLILESIQDPGNLGTMLRTGEGAGISGVIMNRSTVDIFSPKVVRSTMGSLYRVPFYIAEDLSRTVGELKEHGVSVYAAHLKGEKSYDKADYTRGTAFLIGNEGSGLMEETAELADEYIRIPMEGQVESLNAAIAASLLMYEAYRQRRS